MICRVPEAEQADASASTPSATTQTTYRDRERERCVSTRFAPSTRNIIHLKCTEPRQKFARLVMLEKRVSRFNHQKEAVLRRPHKFRHVEHRMIRHGQAVECQHP